MEIDKLKDFVETINSIDKSGVCSLENNTLVVTTDANVYKLEADQIKSISMDRSRFKGTFVFIATDDLENSIVLNVFEKAYQSTIYLLSNLFIYYINKIKWPCICFSIGFLLPFIFKYFGVLT